MRIKPVVRLLGLIALAAFPLTAPTAGAENNRPPMSMDKYTVNKKHLLCFGLAITLWEDNNTHRVLEMYVKDVQAGSQAEAEGLSPGTKIYSVDGKPVDSFEATFDTESGLGKIFVDRKRGDRVTLEVGLPGHSDTKTVTLTHGLVVTVAHIKDR